MIIETDDNKCGNKKVGLLVILSSICSVTNDALMKLSSITLDSSLIMFIRYCVMVIVLFKKSKLKYFLNNYKSYIFRSLILFLAMLLWIKGIGRNSLSNASFYSYLTPVITYFFYNNFFERKILLKSYIVLGIIFVLIIAVANYKNNVLIHTLKFDFYLTTAIILFALSESINKKFVSIDYSNDIFCIGTIICFFSFPYAIWNFQIIKLESLIYCILTGIINTVMYLALFKAYTLSSMSVIAILKYTEFPLSIILDRVIFKTTVSINEFIILTMMIIFIIFLSIFAGIEKEI
jgi:drug/metabolite transporter (DMT)-like permease